MIKDKNIAPNAWISLSKVLFLSDAPIVAETTNATLTVDNFNSVITNTGASGAITLTLPAASSVAWKALKVYVTVAQIINLSPASTESVYLAWNWVVDKDLIVPWVIGNYVDIYSDWVKYLVWDYSGALVKEA